MSGTMAGQPDAAKRVLVTGAAGVIGRALREELHERYHLRLMYHRTVLPQQGRDEVIVADITDLAQMEAACEGMDAIVHLAADPNTGAPWSSILPKNIVGAYNIYEAAHRHGVNCVVFASTNHVMGMYETDGVPQRPELLPVRPDGYYGASKAFGEALGRYYADAFGLRVICLRIGSFVPQPTAPRTLATWLSARDMAQLTWRSIESSIPFGVYNAISGNSRRYWDITSAQRELGYDPDDNAEDYAAAILAAPE